MGLLGSTAVAGGAPDSAALDATQCSCDNRLGGWVAGAASTLRPRPLVIQPDADREQVGDKPLELKPGMFRSWASWARIDSRSLIHSPRSLLSGQGHWRIRRFRRCQAATADSILCVSA